MGRRSVEEHTERIAALVRPALDALGTEEVPLSAALGRVTAAPVLARHPLPPFRNSQMDGYAAWAGDLARAPVVLPVDGVQPAAAAAVRSLAAGALRKVMTGAPLPEGADCVVPVEDTEAVAEGVRVLRPRVAGEFVREAGGDLPEGAVVVEAGVRLAPRHLAAAAAAGSAAVLVRRRARVAVLTSGTEVVPPGVPLAFGQVHDANGTALRALVLECGADCVLLAHTSDDSAAFGAELHDATAAADLVVTAGGISKGDFEVVRQVLQPLGADVVEVAMQPGGPQARALVNGVPVICFPGNPVSAQVSFTVFLQPLLRAAAGIPPIQPRVLPLAVAVRSPAGRRQWLRGVVLDGRAHPVGGPGSHLVAAMARAEVLIDVPAEAESLAAGDGVGVLPL